MIVYENNWFRIRREDNYHWLEEPKSAQGAVILCVRGETVAVLKMQRPAQFEHAEPTTFEIPRGYADAGETALQCARRELQEETGLDVDEELFDYLGHIRPNTAVLSSRISAFHVSIPADAPQAPHTDEAKEVLFVPLNQLWADIASGQIEDGFTLATITLAKAKGLI